MAPIVLKVRNWAGDLLSLPPVDNSDTLDILKRAILAELSDKPEPSFKIVIRHNGQPISGDRRHTLNELGLKDGDILTIEFVPPAKPGVKKVIDDVTLIHDQLLRNTADLFLLQITNPPLAKALMLGDFQLFSKLLKEILADHDKMKDAKLKELEDHEESKVNDCLTKFLADVNNNVKLNEVEDPYAYSTRTLTKFCDVRGPAVLFVKVTVNGHGVNAHVNPGSAITTMSKICATRTRVIHLLEPSTSPVKTYTGISAATSYHPNPNATLKVFGKIHNFNIEIDHKFLNTTFSIVENQKWEMILGLDFLKFHKFALSLDRNLLISAEVQTPFVHEPTPKLA